MRFRYRDILPSQGKPRTRTVMVQPAHESREGGTHDSGVIGWMYWLGRRDCAFIECLGAILYLLVSEF
jgi:hypothetical protein